MPLPPDNLHCVIHLDGRRITVELEPLPDGKTIFETDAKVSASIPTSKSTKENGRYRCQ
jgi:hypothetical protein